MFICPDELQGMPAEEAERLTIGEGDSLLARFDDRFPNTTGR